MGQQLPLGSRAAHRDDMQVGDQAFFYHSNCKQPGIVGIVKVVSEAYPDHTAWDPESKYYDPKSSEENPRWYMVDIRYVRKLKRLISLEELKNAPQLVEMPLVRKGNRLSVMPVSEEHWQIILDMENG